MGPGEPASAPTSSPDLRPCPSAPPPRSGDRGRRGRLPPGTCVGRPAREACHRQAIVPFRARSRHAAPDRRRPLGRCPAERRDHAGRAERQGSGIRSLAEPRGRRGKSTFRAGKLRSDRVAAGAARGQRSAGHARPGPACLEARWSFPRLPVRRFDAVGDARQLLGGRSRDCGRHQPARGTVLGSACARRICFSVPGSRFRWPTSSQSRCATPTCSGSSATSAPWAERTR